MSHALPREWFSTSIRNDSLKREKARFRIWNITMYLVAFALPLGALLFYIWQGVQVIRTGYEIDLLRREHQELQTERDRLKVELASLENLSAVEKLAMGEMGMVYPAPDQVVHVRDTTPPAARAANSSSRDADESPPGKGLLTFVRKVVGAP